MKTIIMSAMLSLSLSAFAQGPQNAAYAKQAVLSAKALNTINWGSNKSESLEVIKESLKEDGDSLIGNYKVRLFIKDEKTKTKSDGGKDFDVYIFDGAVLNVKVDCRMCG